MALFKEKFDTRKKKNMKKLKSLVVRKTEEKKAELMGLDDSEFQQKLGEITEVDKVVEQILEKKIQSLLQDDSSDDDLDDKFQEMI